MCLLDTWAQEEQTWILQIQEEHGGRPVLDIGPGVMEHCPQAQDTDLSS